MAWLTGYDYHLHAMGGMDIMNRENQEAGG